VSFHTHELIIVSVNFVLCSQNSMICSGCDLGARWRELEEMPTL
jgi:hypothetical protein